MEISDIIVDGSVTGAEVEPPPAIRIKLWIYLTGFKYYGN